MLKDNAKIMISDHIIIQDETKKVIVDKNGKGNIDVRTTNK